MTRKAGLHLIPPQELPSSQVFGSDGSRVRCLAVDKAVSKLDYPPGAGLEPPKGLTRRDPTKGPLLPSTA